VNVFLRIIRICDSCSLAKLGVLETLFLLSYLRICEVFRSEDKFSPGMSRRVVWWKLTLVPDVLAAPIGALEIVLVIIIIVKANFICLLYRLANGA
jgi:hypothetical protein